MTYKKLLTILGKLAGNLKDETGYKFMLSGIKTVKNNHDTTINFDSELSINERHSLLISSVSAFIQFHKIDKNDYMKSFNRDLDLIYNMRMEQDNKE